MGVYSLGKRVCLSDSAGYCLWFPPGLSTSDLVVGDVTKPDPSISYFSSDYFKVMLGSYSSSDYFKVMLGQHMEQFYFFTL